MVEPALSASPCMAHCTRRAARIADCRLKNFTGRIAPWGGSGAPPEAERTSRQRATAGESTDHETSAPLPLLSPVRSRSESTMLRGAAPAPFCAPGTETCESVGAGTRSCRRLAILFTSRPLCLGAPESKNDCASPGEVVVYQPERTVVNVFVCYRNRILNGQGNPCAGILAKLSCRKNSRVRRWQRPASLSSRGNHGIGRNVQPG